MNDVALLGALKRTELRNKLRLLLATSRFKIAVIAVFSVAFWLSLYHLFYQGMKFVHDQGVQSYFEELMAGMFYVFFFALSMMLTFSNAIISYTSFYKSKETTFLLSSPVRPESIFLYKFGESIAFSSWAFLFLATPLMAAYGRLYHAAWTFYAGAGLFFFVYMFLPAAVGSIVAMIVTSYVPRTRKGLVIGVVLACLIFAITMVSRLLSIGPAANVDIRLAMEIFEAIGFSRNPLLPSYWMGKGLILLRSGDLRGAAFFLALITSNALFLVAVAHAVASRLVVKGWFVSQGLRTIRKYGAAGALDWIAHKLLFFTDPQVRLIVIKDLKSFVRDPVQWSQFLIFFGLLAIYFLNLRTFGYDDRSSFWKNLIAQMNLLATSLTLATFSSRFIFPQLSLEGRRFWVIGLVPMARDKILFGKLALCFVSSLLISETLILVSSWMLKTPLSLAVLHSLALFGICLGLAGLSVGLGALYPNFNEDNPSKIVAGFGGTLNLVLSLTFVMIVLVAQSIPCFFYFGRSTIGPGEFRSYSAIAMVVIMGVSLAACLVPMSMGIKAVNRLEV
jgi:ABC-2 type transport system permease protein